MKHNPLSSYKILKPKTVKLVNINPVTTTYDAGQLCNKCSQLVQQGKLKPYQGIPECIIREQNLLGFSYLIANGKVYDVSDFIRQHPGGSGSIIKRIKNGTDCSVDFRFHSKQAKHLWERYLIGKLIRCGDKPLQKQCCIM